MYNRVETLYSVGGRKKLNVSLSPLDVAAGLKSLYFADIG